MAAGFLNRVLGGVAFYTFGLFNVILYLGLFLSSGAFFKRDSEQDRLQYAIERDRFWNLSKAPLPGFKHQFYTLRNKLQLHYITNRDGVASQGHLIIFFHGFPDSCVMWRHLMQEPALPIQDATIVCVDLPGYGGSDSFKKYDTEVLEALTEFVVAMREKYILPDDVDATNTFIVGHDWGCILGFRLAADAPCLADRFILTNAPHPQLALANKQRILDSANKIFKQFRQSPIQNVGCLSKSLHTLKPLLWQVMLFGYTLMFNLPRFFVETSGTMGNYSFLKGSQRHAYGPSGAEEYRVQESMASSMGPGIEECETNTAMGGRYGSTVAKRAKSSRDAFWQMTGYYRDGVGFKKWTKSLETIADMYTLETSASESSSPGRRRSSISNGLFVDQYKGKLAAPTYVLWGEKDLACTRPICLDGLGDYLGRDSEVTILPEAGHWTPIEKSSRVALATVIGLFAGRDSKPVSKMTTEVQKVYEGAVMMVKK